MEFTNGAGLYHTPLNEALVMMPGLRPVVAEAPLQDGESYIVDVKVHMLMPGQWPCIPNWHRDFVPRDEEGNLCPEEIDSSKTMFLWLSGPPLTEFRGGRKVTPRTWIPFTQEDEHRGTASTRHCWRTFIRLVPTPLLLPARPEMWLRRHTQVYLDAGRFTW